LKDLSSPSATVLRDGQKQEVDASKIVPGDIVFLTQGDAVPADARVLDEANLETDESALTGESVQVAKEAETPEEETPLAERSNMVYKNTTVVKGRGKVVVVATGMDTAVGDIAEQLEEAEDTKTPFQQEVDHLGKQIGYGIMAIILLVAIYSGAMYGGSIAAILVNVPGTAAAAATTFDGYPMSQQGKAKDALAMSAMASSIGGFFTIIALFLISGVLVQVVLAFGSPEYFLIAMLGISMITVVAQGSMVKGLISGFFGLLLTTIGIVSVSGVSILQDSREAERIENATRVTIPDAGHLSNLDNSEAFDEALGRFLTDR